MQDTGNVHLVPTIREEDRWDKNAPSLDTITEKDGGLTEIPFQLQNPFCIYDTDFKNPSTVARIWFNITTQTHKQTTLIKLKKTNIKNTLKSKNMPAC